MSQNVFNSYSKYYDLLYRDKDYEGEAKYIVNLLRIHGITNGSLLEFGSGTGKHGCILANNGYTIDGIELSQEMVSNASTAPGFSILQGDICRINMKRKYDAVLSLFHVISYQLSSGQLNDVFNNAASHLNVGGLFIFDFWYSPAVYTQKPNVRVKRMMDEHIEITRIAEPIIYSNENRVDVNYTIFERNLNTGIVNTMRETHPMRHFSLPEIDLLANLHGFERVKEEEFLTKNAPSENTWGICVILKRI